MENKKISHGLGSALLKRKSYVFLFDEENIKRNVFCVQSSDDGIVFSPLTENAKILNINGPADDVQDCSEYHLSQDGRIFYLTYFVSSRGAVAMARSKNLIDWEKCGELSQMTGGAKIVTDYWYAGRHAMFSGGDALRLYVSTDLERWTRAKRELIACNVHEEYINGDERLSVVDVQVVDDGVFVLYCITYSLQGAVQYALYGALFDYGDPTKLIWRSHCAVYKTRNTTRHQSRLFGAVLYEEYFASYWTDSEGDVIVLRHGYKHDSDDEMCDAICDVRAAHHEQCESSGLALSRVTENPIVKPQDCCPWEAKATYNPTAFVHDGVVHIIYRAEGHDMVSVLGYASSMDGITIDDRLPYCIYRRKIKISDVRLPMPIPYTSGGDANGGCEDPRVVLIDDMVHITYTAFDGWGSVRVALTSIALDDFLNKRWNWKRTVLISPPGEMNKNWVLFPEKINGKYAILHSFYPKILIDYFDDLEELDGRMRFINSNNTRPIDPTRTWDSWFRGVGPAPIRTEDGWLVFYHAMNCKNPDRYKLGALILDGDDPTKILYRSANPILEPREYYENDGFKWGVVYCCGAVVKEDTLFVYYGGSDKYVCVATAPLGQFLEDLKRTGNVTMTIN